MKSIKLFALIVSLLNVPVLTYGQDTSADAKKFYDLGMSDRQANKHDSAIANLKKALAIYEKDGAKNSEALVKTLIYLSDSSALLKKYNEGEEFISYAAAKGEELFGKNDPRMLVVYKSLTDYRIMWENQIEKRIGGKKVSSEQLIMDSLAKRYDLLLALSTSPARTDERITVENEYACYAADEEETDDLLRLRHSMKTTTPLFAVPEKVGRSGPGWPVSMRRAKVVGQIPLVNMTTGMVVRIEVNELGEVKSAVSVCKTPKAYAEAAIISAWSTKFAPLLKDGKAVKFSDFLHYSFKLR